MDRISEGKVYELKRFLVAPKKRNYRLVEGQYMIWIGKYASVVEINDSIVDFPLCTYALTKLDQLPGPQDVPACFTGTLALLFVIPLYKLWVFFLDSLLSLLFYL